MDLLYIPSVGVQALLYIGFFFFLWCCYTAPQKKAPGKYCDLYDWIILGSTMGATIRIIIAYIILNNV